MAAKTKLELILEMKNRMKKALGKARTDAAKSVQKIKGRFSNMKAHAMNTFREMRDQIPGLSSALSLLKNPYALIAAGIAAVGLAAFKLGGHLLTVSKEVKSLQREIKTYSGLTGKELRETTAEVSALKKVFNADSKEIIASANAMQREFKNLSFGDSLRLIREGLTATNGSLDLAQIKEYSTHAKAAGLNAEQMIALISKSRNMGIYDDKAIDSVKEFGLRIRENTPAVRDALKHIGISSVQVQKDLNSGSKSVFDIMRQVSGAMKDVNVQARQTAIADLFGGPGEDAGLPFLLSLHNMKLGMKDLIDLQDPYIRSQQKRLSLEKEILMQQQRFTTDVSGLKTQFDLIVLQAKVLFYTYLADGIQWMKDLYNNSLMLKGIVAAIALNFKAVWFQIKLVFKALSFGIKLALIPFKLLMSGIRWLIDSIRNTEMFQRFSNAMHMAFDVVKGRIMYLVELAKKAGEVISNALDFKMDAAGKHLKDLRLLMKGGYQGYVVRQKLIEESREIVKNGNDNIVDSSPTNPTASPSVSLVPETKQVKSLTINIEAFHKGDTILRQEGELSEGKSPEEMEEWFDEMMMRLMRNAEKTH